MSSYKTLHSNFERFEFACLPICFVKPSLSGRRAMAVSGQFFWTQEIFRWREGSLFENLLKSGNKVRKCSRQGGGFDEIKIWENLCFSFKRLLLHFLTKKSVSWVKAQVCKPCVLPGRYTLCYKVVWVRKKVTDTNLALQSWRFFKLSKCKHRTSTSWQPMMVERSPNVAAVSNFVSNFLPETFVGAQILSSSNTKFNWLKRLTFLKRLFLVSKSI